MARRPAPRPTRGAPQRDYAAEYARRKARGIAQGKTVAEARGHGPVGGEKEHVRRKRREAHEDLTTYQRGKIREFARRQAARIKANPERMATVLIEKATKLGYERFREMADFVRREHRKKQKAGKVVMIRGRANNAAIMEEFAEEWDIDLDWLWYG